MAEERPHRGPGEVPLAVAVLELGLEVDRAGDRGVEAEAGAGDEVAAGRVAEVDLPRLPVVGHPQQVLGGVDDLAGDAEHLADDVRRPAGQVGERDVGAGQPVGRLVQRAVAAEGDDHVVALVDRLADELGRVALALGVERGDLVAALERVDDEVAQPVRDRRRVRVDDDEHPPLLDRLLEGEGLAEALEGVEGRGHGRHAARFYTAVARTALRAARGASRRDGPPTTTASASSATSSRAAGVTVRQDDVVLDLGCGAGRLTRALARRAAHVIALDVSPRDAPPRAGGRRAAQQRHLAARRRRDADRDRGRVARRRPRARRASSTSPTRR